MIIERVVQEYIVAKDYTIAACFVRLDCFELITIMM